MSHKLPPSLLPATESGLPSATDKAGRFPFSAVSSAVLVIATGLGLVSCGGGGGGSSATSVNIAGQAIKGPVSGGQVCAYTLSSPRQQIACTTTDSNANYQLQLPAGTGEVLLEVTGGSYIDEATGQKVTLTTPLRTLTKAGGPVSNVLMTPFTELAVQRATTGNPGGNLTLVGFQTQIGQLETGLGITGLAIGKPFGGKASADITHQKALEAFSKLQNGQGKDVGGALQIMGSELDKCGANSLGVTLAIYSAAGTVSVASGGGLLKIAQLEMQQSLQIGSAGGAGTKFDANTVSIGSGNLLVNNKTSTDGAVFITGIRGTSIDSAGGVLISTTPITLQWGIALPGALAVDLTASGVGRSKTLCLEPANGSPAFSGLSIVTSKTQVTGLTGGGIGLDNGVVIMGGSTSSGGGSVVVSGGGLTTNGTSGSVGGGVTVGSKTK